MDRIAAAQVFVDIAHSGSFTATSQRLAMSRSMVTRYIDEIEQWFDARLLHRTTRKVSLTTAGEQCLQDIEPWLKTADRLVSNLKSTDNLSDSIRVSTSISLGHAQLMKAICLFMKKHPNVSIDVDLGDSAIDLVKARIDLAIRISANPDNSLIGKPIAVCRSVLVASNDYLQNMPTITHPKDLASHHCLGYNNFGNLVWHLQNGQQHHATPVVCKLTANEATALLEASICGAGISMQPTYMANTFIERGDLVKVLPQWRISDMNIYALYSSRKFQSPTVRALIDFLVEYFEVNPWDNA